MSTMPTITENIVIVTKAALFIRCLPYSPLLPLTTYSSYTYQASHLPETGNDELGMATPLSRS